MSNKERRRQTIDMEWFEKTMKSYIEHLGFSVEHFSIWGHPDDIDPVNGVSFRMKVLGWELPTPDEYIQVMKDAFGEDYYCLPEDKRNVPIKYKGAMYLGSVKDRYLTWDDAQNEVYTDVHYFLLDDVVFPFNDDWEMPAGPRELLMSFDSLKNIARWIGKFEKGR